MIVAEKTRTPKNEVKDSEQRSDLEKRLEEAKRAIERQPEPVRVQMSRYLKHC